MQSLTMRVSLPLEEENDVDNTTDQAGKTNCFISVNSSVLIDEHL